MSFNLKNISQQFEDTETAKSSSTGNWLEKEIWTSKSFGSKQKEVFYTELTLLLKSGINLKQALTLVIEGFSKKNHQLLFGRVLQHVVGGQSLSKAMQLEKLCNEYEFYALQMGEESGQLLQVAEQLGLYFKTKNTQKRELLQALTYPVIVLITAVVVVVFMLNFIVPIFQDMFKQNNIELPAITKVILNFSAFLKSNGWLFVVFLFLLIALKKPLLSIVKFKQFIHFFCLRIPFFGDYIKKARLAQFASAMALLSGASVPLLKSLQLVSKMIGFLPLKNALIAVANEIIRGKNLSSCMQEHTIFDKRMITLITVAEETNQTASVFSILNEQYSQQLSHQSKLVGQVLNPLLILFVGILVGVILVAMYLPMFQLSSVIQ